MRGESVGGRGGPVKWGNLSSLFEVQRLQAKLEDLP
jgi:hypothetical protein